MMAHEVHTLADVARLEAEFLVPSQVAAVLGCDQYMINLASRTADGRASLGFPVIRIGNRVKIPRRPFLAFMGWTGPTT